MIELFETRRTRWLLVSAMNTSPVALTVTPLGRFSRAEVATWPSPVKPSTPAVPAKTVTAVTPLVLTARMT